MSSFRQLPLSTFVNSCVSFVDRSWTPGGISYSDRLVYQPIASEPIRTLQCKTVDNVFVYLFGPIEFKNSNTWAYIEASIELPEGDYVGHTVEPVDSQTFQVIPNPPFHLHHTHIHPYITSDVHFFETHGDYWQAQGDGYARRLPYGYCNKHRHREDEFEQTYTDTLNAFYQQHNQRSRVSYDRVNPNWMRVESTNVLEGDTNSSRSYYLRVAFEKTTSPCKQIHRIVSYPSFMPSMLDDPLARFHLKSPSDSVMWWQWDAGIDGHVVAVWTHAHLQRLQGSMLMWNDKHDGTVLDMARILGNDYERLQNDRFSDRLLEHYSEHVTCHVWSDERDLMGPHLDSVPSITSTRSSSKDCPRIPRRVHETTRISAFAFFKSGANDFPMHHLFLMLYHPQPNATIHPKQISKLRTNDQSTLIRSLSDETYWLGGVEDEMDQSRKLRRCVQNGKFDARCELWSPVTSASVSLPR